MSRLLAAAALASLVVVLGCPPPASTDDGNTKSSSTKGDKGDKKKAQKDEKKDEDGADDDVSDKPSGFKPPPATDISEDRMLAALKAENAQLKLGKPAYTGVIDAHEHLYKMKDLEKYIPAARAQGVVTTVVVSSALFTLEGKGGQKGEPSMSENFENVVLEAAKKYPGEIVPFCTLDPHDSDKLARLKKHVEMGCKGLKLYSGHSNYYDGPLDSADMDPVYSYLEETQLPVLWHVHLGKYMDDFEKVINKHPKMNLLVPHYGVTFWKPKDGNLDRLKKIMRAHKNIYVDTSLGTRGILLDGMAAMEPALDDFRSFFTEFQDQIVWGTDSVITGNVEKTTGWFEKVIACTKDQLEKDTFTTDLAAQYSKYWQKGRDPDGRYQGLHLPPEILKKVYVDNAKRWLKIK